MISILIPVFNESENIELLYKSILNTFKEFPYNFEIIYINDGSKDGTKELLNKLAKRNKMIKVIHFMTNYGQTAALTAGIDYAQGDIIIPMDGDNQNDPADIPVLLEKINEGYDVVSGWRKNRKDKFISRILPSKIANLLISLISGIKLHDYGCSLKAYKRDVIKNVKLYGEMHRFIPIYAAWEGGKVTEIVVRHHPRKHGKSKYGTNRILKVLLDLSLIKFLNKYARNPIYLFGKFCIWNLFFSFLSFIFMLYLKYWGGKSFIETPLPLLAILFLLMGILSIFVGFMAEILMRTYYESQGKSIYTISEKVNFD